VRLMRYSLEYESVSIHAPVRGATVLFLTSATVNFSFNPRPRAGGDVMIIGYVSGSFCFNPRPRAGGDLYKKEGIKEWV